MQHFDDLVHHQVADADVEGRPLEHHHELATELGARVPRDPVAAVEQDPLVQAQEDQAQGCDGYADGADDAEEEAEHAELGDAGALRLEADLDAVEYLVDF